MKIHLPSLLCLLLSVSCSDSKQTIETADATMAVDREIGDGLPQDDPTLITATSLALHIRGMSCPKCVTNAEIQLERLPGVSGRDARHGRRNLSNQSEARCTRDAGQSRPSHLGGGIHLGGD